MTTKYSNLCQIMNTSSTMLSFAIFLSPHYSYIKEYPLLFVYFHDLSQSCQNSCHDLIPNSHISTVLLDGRGVERCWQISILRPSRRMAEGFQEPTSLSDYVLVDMKRYEGRFYTLFLQIRWPIFNRKCNLSKKQSQTPLLEAKCKQDSQF